MVDIDRGQPGKFERAQEVDCTSFLVACEGVVQGLGIGLLTCSENDDGFLLKPVVIFI